MTELPSIPEFDTPAALRRALRGSAYPHPTFGAAPGYLQCNLLILPHGLARDFSRFCAANPQACPLIYESAPGQFDLDELGEAIDLRTDLGSYRVFRDGQAEGDLLNLNAYWQGDFVAFLLGSSFGVEAVLGSAGIAMPWVQRGETPAHYITGRDLSPAGPFRGPMAVTMRPLREADAEEVRELCAAYPHLHGLPLAVGDPGELGIETLDAPVADTGETTRVGEGEVPVFWASALSAQLALSAARLPLCITNTPGYLLVTDIEIEALRQEPLELTERADADEEVADEEVATEDGAEGPAALVLGAGEAPDPDDAAEPEKLAHGTAVATSGATSVATSGEDADELPGAGAADDTAEEQIATADVGNDPEAEDAKTGDPDAGGPDAGASKAAEPEAADLAAAAEPNDEPGTDDPLAIPTFDMVAGGDETDAEAPIVIDDEDDFVLLAEEPPEDTPEPRAAHPTAGESDAGEPDMFGAQADKNGTVDAEEPGSDDEDPTTDDRESGDPEARSGLAASATFADIPERPVSESRLVRERLAAARQSGHAASTGAP